MKAVLKYRLSSGEVVECCPYGFKWANFTGTEVISGDKYYIEKAVILGAIKPKAKKKAKAKDKT